MTNDLFFFFGKIIDAYFRKLTLRLGILGTANNESRSQKPGKNKGRHFPVDSLAPKVTSQKLKNY